MLSTAAANAVTIVTAGSSNYITGVISNNGAVDAVDTVNTLTFVSGTAVAGDRIVLEGISATEWSLFAICSGTGGITAA
jgi:hypothetical protein